MHLYVYVANIDRCLLCASAKHLHILTRLILTTAQYPHELGSIIIISFLQMTKLWFVEVKQDVKHHTANKKHS